MPKPQARIAVSHMSNAQLYRQLQRQLTIVETAITWGDGREVSLGALRAASQVVEELRMRGEQTRLNI